jgi:signal transduction histidine kinase/ligand-binding sensor domain-containing protein/DNA-binding response OmpR family regulator
MKFFFLLTLALQFLAWPGQGQEQNLTFERLSTGEGLSHSVVNCILQDREGFLWIGTQDGLNRYDGYSFQHFEHDRNDPTSLSNNTVKCLYEDRRGDLWVGTANGLNTFDKTTQRFRVYRHESDNPRSLSHNDIRSIYEDRSQVLWIGNYVGLNKLDRQTGAFTLYEHEPGHPDKWARNLIIKVYEDRQGMLWLGTTQGISLFDRNTQRFRRFPRSDVSPGDIKPQHAVRDLLEDKAGVMWVATYGDGLMEFNRKTGQYQAYLPDPGNAHSISSTHILALFEDAAGMLWVGTQTHGLSRYDRSKGIFTHYSHNPKNAKTLSHNSVNAIFEDRSNVLWVGTFEGGLNKVDLLRKKFTHLYHNPADSRTILENDINALCEDASGNIWMSNNFGLDKLDQKSGLITHYQYPMPPDNHGDHNAHCIYEDQAGRIWVGLQGGGLKRFDRSTKRFTSYHYNSADSGSIPNGNVTSIFQDKQGTIWIGTFFGLSRYDERAEKFITHMPTDVPTKRFVVKKILEDVNGKLWLAAGEYGLYQFDPGLGIFSRYAFQNTAFRNLAIHSLYEDYNGLLWIGLESGGLLYLDRKTSVCQPVTQPQVLTKTIIRRILEDARGNLWMSTSKDGIYKFNPGTGMLNTYDAFDGLQGDEFLAAGLKSSGGKMYFGGKNGLTVFHPDSIRSNPNAPPVAISGFKVFDKPRPFAAELTLPYRDNFFSFDFVALSYAFPAKNQYAYQLEGLDEDWVPAGSRRYVSYTNLDPGTYVFRVKAANHDGVWNNKGASVKIIITPPWWRTAWAYSLYAGLFMGIIVALRQYTINQERLKNNLLLSSLEAKKLVELDQLKSRFFTSISHELRTPLTLILSPLERNLSSDHKGVFREPEVQLMYRNSRRLLELINQLLDISKLEAGKMQIEALTGELVSFMQAKVDFFRSMAENKGISLRFSTEPETLYTRFDQDKLDKIVSNLLSNALKFTPAGGEVVVRIWLKIAPESSVAPQWMVLEVQDTGIGIPSDQLEKIFDRFYQVDSSHTKEFEGTGIGLALTRELVSLHQGTIQVSSSLGKGTCFTIELPLWEMGNAAGTEGKQPNVLSLSEVTPIRLDSPVLAAQTKVQPNELAPLLLIVEDNADLRTYIRSVFQTSYRIVEARQGEEGLQMALEKIPDLVISDWMMPVMDGVELCHHLKTDERTSHIPFILLTAKITVQSKLEGLETGADDYITKPFHTEELFVRVKNLIEQRTSLRKRWNQAFSQLPASAPVPASHPLATPKLNAVDDKFLQRVIQVIEANLSDSEFSIERLEKESGMSHANLNRKLKALTDQSPSEFLRYYRLRRAAQLLLQRGNNVSEVAYQVGFVHLSYFTKSFRQLYKMSPSEYQAAHLPDTEPRT